METKQNHKYYFDNDPMAVILVGGQLFKVHRHYLMQGSPFFRKLFSSLDEEGVSDLPNNQLPIPLQEVTAEEFESLLDYFYRPLLLQPTWLTLQVYLNLLRVSRQYLFDDVMQFSLQGLETFKADVQPVDRLLLGDKYQLEDWISSAYTQMLYRSESLTEQEAETLGYERLVKFIADRGEYFAQQLELKPTFGPPTTKGKKQAKR